MIMEAPMRLGGSVLPVVPSLTYNALQPLYEKISNVSKIDMHKIFVFRCSVAPYYEISPASAACRTLVSYDVLNHFPSLHLPSLENVVLRRSYMASMSMRNRSPNWVAERLTASKVFSENVTRKGKGFKSDTAVPIIWRALDSDYVHSDFSRGHMAAAANHLVARDDLEETFILNDNVVPQSSSNNSGVWAEMEKLSRNMTLFYDSVYVISGPLWMPESMNVQNLTHKNDNISYPIIGKNMIPAPTHLFKIIYGVRDDVNNKSIVHKNLGKLPCVALATFIVPNKNCKRGYIAKDFLVPLSNLETVSGLDFSGIRNHADVMWQQEGVGQEGGCVLYYDVKRI